ncbi:MAG: 50S ribosomal protein L31 [Eubacteriales bacterium]
MKEGIHPKYVDATVRCACGEVIQTKSTKGDFKVEICSKCHPFYTGKQKFVDSGGRVDKLKNVLKERNNQVNDFDLAGKRAA